MQRHVDVVGYAAIYAMLLSVRHVERRCASAVVFIVQTPCAAEAMIAGACERYYAADASFR